MHKILFYSKFIVRLYMFRALCVHHLEVKTVLYSIWYHLTETSEWSKITKIQFYKYKHIIIIIIIIVVVIIICNLSNDRSKASSKTIPPHSAI